MYVLCVTRWFQHNKLAGQLIWQIIRNDKIALFTTTTMDSLLIDCKQVTTANMFK